VHLQHVTAEDLVFMSGCGHLHSTAVYVLNFTLLGSMVRPCDSSTFFPPCVTYVREDDDCDTFARRVASIVGDDDWAKYRLAVVGADKSPRFVPRSSASSAAATNGGGRDDAAVSSDSQAALADSMEVEGEGETDKISPTAMVTPTATSATLWSILSELYPHEVKNHPNAEKAKPRLPLIGIQRSASSSARIATTNGSSITIK